MSETTQILVHFFSNIDILLLIMVRVLGFVIIMPVLAGSNIPTVVKVGFSLCIAYVIFVSNKIVEIEYFDNVFGYGILIVEEFIVGFLIAFVVYIIFSVMYFVGHLIDSQIGLSMVSILDPITQIQAPIAGNLLFMVMSLFLVQSGGLQEFIQALYYSYDLIPLGHAVFLENPNIASQLLKILASYFSIGVQISMPIVGAILILDIALGILVKAVPQMNVFVVGLPIKLLFGLGIFYFIFPVFYDVYVMLFDNSIRSVIAMIKGMT